MNKNEHEHSTNKSLCSIQHAKFQHSDARGSENICLCWRSFLDRSRRGNEGGMGDNL